MNVVALLLDTLRYDHAHQIPQFAELAAKGWDFERMYGGSTFTYPNLCTLRSGLYPHNHGWRSFPQHAPFHADTTLCECLEKAGYFISTSLEAPPLPETQELIRPDAEPFFRFCWFTGIHDCAYGFIYNGVDPLIYKNCVSTCADWLDEALSLFSDSLILLFGDHGVGLKGEHLRKEGHDVGAGQVYDFRIRVPCVLAGPGLTHRVIKEAHSMADLMPIMLDILGIPIPDGLDGQLERSEPVFLEAQSPNSPWPSKTPNVFGATDGKIKVMFTPGGWRCYDLINDPAEKNHRPDLLRSEDARPLRAIIQERMN